MHSSYEKKPINKKQVGLYVDKRLHEKVSVRCRRSGVTISELIRMLLEAYLAKEVELVKHV